MDVWFWFLINFLINKYIRTVNRALYYKMSQNVILRGYTISKSNSLRIWKPLIKRWWSDASSSWLYRRHRCLWCMVRVPSGYEIIWFKFLIIPKRACWMWLYIYDRYIFILYILMKLLYVYISYTLFALFLHNTALRSSQFNKTNSLCRKRIKSRL